MIDQQCSLLKTKTHPEIEINFLEVFFFIFGHLKFVSIYALFCDFEEDFTSTFQFLTTAATILSQVLYASSHFSLFDKCSKLLKLIKTFFKKKL